MHVWDEQWDKPGELELRLLCAFMLYQNFLFSDHSILDLIRDLGGFDLTKRSVDGTIEFCQYKKDVRLLPEWKDNALSFSYMSEETWRDIVFRTLITVISSTIDINRIMRLFNLMQQSHAKIDMDCVGRLYASSGSILVLNLFSKQFFITILNKMFFTTLGTNYDRTKVIDFVDSFYPKHQNLIRNHKTNKRPELNPGDVIELPMLRKIWSCNQYRLSYMRFLLKNHRIDLIEASNYSLCKKKIIFFIVQYHDMMWSQKFFCYYQNSIDELHYGNNSLEAREFYWCDVQIEDTTCNRFTVDFPWEIRILRKDRDEGEYVALPLIINEKIRWFNNVWLSIVIHYNSEKNEFYAELLQDQGRYQSWVEEAILTSSKSINLGK